MPVHGAVEEAILFVLFFLHTLYSVGSMLVRVHGTGIGTKIPPTRAAAAGLANGVGSALHTGDSWSEGLRLGTLASISVEWFGRVSWSKSICFSHTGII